MFNGSSYIYDANENIANFRCKVLIGYIARQQQVDSEIPENVLKAKSFDKMCESSIYANSKKLFMKGICGVCFSTFQYQKKFFAR